MPKSMKKFDIFITLYHDNYFNFLKHNIHVQGNHIHFVTVWKLKQPNYFCGISNASVIFISVVFCLYV